MDRSAPSAEETEIEQQAPGAAESPRPAPRPPRAPRSEVVEGSPDGVRPLEQRLAAREADIGRARAEAAAARDRERMARAELEAMRSRANAAAGSAPAGTPSAPVAGPAEPLAASGPGSPQLLSTLRQRLIAEQQRVARLEKDLERLRQETSSSPFENKLQTELDAAHKEIADLKATLKTEREARQDLAARYERLQGQLREMSEARTASLSDVQREEIAALKLRQERALADVERDLLLSRQHEKELSDALAAGQGAESLPLAGTVADLRSENSALQVRLDDEHRRNTDLAAKLDVAMRVTDLIFKMQSAGAVVTSPAPAAAAATAWEEPRVIIGADSVEEEPPVAKRAPAKKPSGATAEGPVIGPDGEWISPGSE